MRNFNVIIILALTGLLGITLTAFTELDLSQPWTVWLISVDCLIVAELLNIGDELAESAERAYYSVMKEIQLGREK